MSTIKKLLLPISTLVLVSLLTACNTVEGVGQDIQAGGAALTNAAASTKAPHSSKHKSKAKKVRSTSTTKNN